MVTWDIEVGETLLRKDLHDRWNGGRYGGMAPSVKAESVFLFSNPSAGEAFGYKYHGWHTGGTLQHTGDGQVGDRQRAADRIHRGALVAKRVGLGPGPRAAQEDLPSREL